MGHGVLNIVLSTNLLQGWQNYKLAILEFHWEEIEVEIVNRVQLSMGRSTYNCHNMRHIFYSRKIKRPMTNYINDNENKQWIRK